MSFCTATRRCIRRQSHSPRQGPQRARPRQRRHPTPGPAAAQPDTAPQPPAAPAVAALVADTEERDIRFENESVTAVFTTRGGALKSWRLKKYQDAAREPLELIPANAPAGTVHPFTLSVPDAAASATLAQALFKASATEVSAASAPATLTFEYQDASGLTARKEFSFVPARRLT